MAELSDQLKEIIASVTTDLAELEVVKLSYSTWPEDLYLTAQLDSETEISDNNGTYPVTYVPMTLSEESNDDIIANKRSLTLQGINDIVAEYEDLVEQDSDERIQADVLLLYVNVLTKEVANVQASFTYYVMDVDYSQKNESAVLEISTSPTNNSETGVKFNSVRFPSMKSFE